MEAGGSSSPSGASLEPPEVNSGVQLGCVCLHRNDTEDERALMRECDHHVAARANRRVLEVRAPRPLSRDCQRPLKGLQKKSRTRGRPRRAMSNWPRLGQAWLGFAAQSSTLRGTLVTRRRRKNAENTEHRIRQSQPVHESPRLELDLALEARHERRYRERRSSRPVSFGACASTLWWPYERSLISPCIS